MDTNKIINEDCLIGMKQIPDEFVDLILCDLPYGQTNLEWDTCISIDLLWMQYKRIIKANGAIILFGKQPFTSKLILSNEDMFRYELIWEKTRASNNMLVKKQPSAIHENILVFYKNQPPYNEIKFQVEDKYIDKRKAINDSFYSKGHYKGIMHRKKDDGWRHPQSILPFNSVWHKNMHPTEKPLELGRWLVRTYSNEGDIVLDNAFGSGTFLLAAKLENRRYLGFEIKEEYCKIAENRLKEQTLNGFALRNEADLLLSAVAEQHR